MLSFDVSSDRDGRVRVLIFDSTSDADEPRYMRSVLRIPNRSSPEWMATGDAIDAAPDAERDDDDRLSWHTEEEAEAACAAAYKAVRGKKAKVTP